MTKDRLADLAGMSVSFLSDLTNGKANPSLKIMEIRDRVGQVQQRHVLGHERRRLADGFRDLALFDALGQSWL